MRENMGRIVDAISEALKNETGLTCREVYQKIERLNLYQFGAKDPCSAVNAKLRSHCEGINFPSASPVKLFRKAGEKNGVTLFSLIDAKGNNEVVADKGLTEKEGILLGANELLPEEQMDLVYSFYNNQLKNDLLNKILSCHPSFFEDLVVKLLLKMGYGYDESSGQITQYSKDGGIDGVIYEDKLGLSKIYIQAKRYEPGNVITEPQLQSFVGAMKNVQKGVFVTTSKYTADARKYANEQQQKSLKLIDGDLLAELMIKYGIGLEKVHTYTVYKINEDFFE